MRTLLTLLVLTFLGVPSAQGPKPPFSLSVVPTFNHGEGDGSIEMARQMAREFYVVLTNVSGESQAIWESWNSWGYRAISFEITTADGKRFVISKGLEEFTVNGPTTFVVEPGEHQVYAIRLDKSWDVRPSLTKHDEMPITLKAVYEVFSTPESAQFRVWTGRIESHSYKLSLRQW